jgi:energy-coupling factor transporter ATP-binding protein EcfA2
MRLLGFEIENFRSIEDQWVPADGLVVLFGPNSAGKTSVLEAVEHLVTQAAALRADPGANDEPFVMGRVIFDLPAADFADSADARIYRSLLLGEHDKPDKSGVSADHWAWLDDRLTGLLQGAGLDQARSLLADAFVRAGDAGVAEDRELLARSIFDPRAVCFFAEVSDITLVVRRRALPADVVGAARRLAAMAGDDALSKLATGLVSTGWAHVAQLAGWSFQWESLVSDFPPVIVLDGDLDSLAAELERAVVAIHDRLWHVDLEVVSSMTLPSGGTVEEVAGEWFDIGTGDLGDRYTADPWLETRTEEGEITLPGIVGSYDQGDWYRVRHSVLAAARLIEEEANRVAPGFVKSQGTIGIDVLPVAVWGPGKHRVRATFTEFNSDRRDLRVIGAGTGRWAAAALRLASRRLAQGRQVVVDDAGAAVEEESERRRIVTQAYRAPFTQTAAKVESSDAPAVYLADEPEAHLHPAALQSVREWLTQLAETAAAVLVATHSTALLDSASELVHRVLVFPGDEGTELRQLSGALAGELARVSAELGITKGEILLMTRLAVFVEGPHDQIILDEWFGDDLRASGIRVFPVHGVDNLPGLADSEIASALGMRMATLSDDTSVRRPAAKRARTRGESAVYRLRQEAAKTGLEVKAMGLAQPDILYYLDEAICRQLAPHFPGWHAAAAERAAAAQPPRWKDWIESQYDLPLDRDNVRSLARRCRHDDKIPAELTQKIKELSAYAAATTGPAIMPGPTQSV